MNWTAPNTTPHALLTGDTVVPLIATGEGPGFLWAWDGTDGHLLTWPGGSLAESGQLTRRGGEPVGWVSPMSDMPEIQDQAKAIGDWQRARAQFDGPIFQAWLQEELQMHAQ